MVKVSNFTKGAKIYNSNKLIKNPSVSVILPTYCRGDNGLLRRSIESVLNQTFREFELIIVDDGSTDSTRAVIEEIMKIDNRIVYIRNDINSALPSIRVNQGIVHARGDYIAYQFDDDQWLPNFLSDLYSEIIKKPKDSLVYGKAQIFNVLTGIKEEFNNRPDKELLKTRNLIANASVLHSKSLCYKYGMYDMHLFLKTGCDWDLWKRWIEHVEFHFVDKLVAVIESFHDNSLGKDSEYNQFIFNLLSNKNRNKELTPQAFKNYEVDNIEFIKDFYLKEVVYQQYVLPWKMKKFNVIGENILYSLESSGEVKSPSQVHSQASLIKDSIGASYIAYVMHSGNIGGAENHLLRHAILSKKYGLNVLVCIPEEFKDTISDVSKACLKHDIPLYYMDYDFYITPNNIDKALADNKGLLISKFFTHMNVKLVHSCTLIPALKVAANANEIPYVASLYSTPCPAMVINKNDQRKYMPDVVHSDSVKYANTWSNDVKTYAKCIRTHLPDIFFSSKNGITFDKDTLNIVISGTLQEKKQQLQLITAIGMLKKEGIHMNLKILGYDTFADVYKNQCLREIENYGLENQVVLRGFCEDVEAEMKDMDILVCASTEESFPQVILEAMAQKIIVASTPVGGVPELIINGFSGYLSRGYSSEDLATMLKEIYNDYKNNRNRIYKIIKKASRIVRKECTEYYVAHELFLLYEKALTLTAQESYGYILNNIHTNFDLTLSDKKHVPQNLGLIASEKILSKKSYLIHSNHDVINSLTIYFGTHFKVLRGVMRVRISDTNNSVLANRKYNLAEIEDNRQFDLIFNPPLNINGSFTIEFEFLYKGVNFGISLYEKDGLYVEINQ